MPTEMDEAMYCMPNKIDLQIKQSMRFYAVRGTRVTAIGGVVSIHEPSVWLSEQMIVNKLSLRDGESHLLQGTGWVNIEALERAELFCVAPDSWQLKFGTFIRGIADRVGAYGSCSSRASAREDLRLSRERANRYP